VTKKPNPHPIAAIRKKYLSIEALAAKPGDDHNNSEVIRRIIAITASHKPKSDIESGKIKLITLHR
jgi:hypothetical protein